MSEPFLAEIRMVGFNFAPRGWAYCDGQILPINQNQSLYSLLGTTYGGDGRTSFGLPDLRSRTPIHKGNGYSLGRQSGEETHTLTEAEMPSHNHTFNVTSSNGAFSNGMGGMVFADTGNPNLLAYATETANKFMHSGTILNEGGSQAHENMQPYIAVNFCIAIQGLFPSRN